MLLRLTASAGDRKLVDRKKITKKGQTKEDGKKGAACFKIAHDQIALVCSDFRTNTNKSYWMVVDVGL